MYLRILVVVENDPRTNAAVAQGLALAREHAAELVFLCVVTEATIAVADYPIPTLDVTGELSRAVHDKARADLDAARQLADDAGLRCRTIESSAQDGATCVVETARQLGCDLIVVESLGRNSVMRLLAGSVIPGLITLSSVPVLVVRHGSSLPEPGVRPGTGAGRGEVQP